MQLSLDQLEQASLDISSHVRSFLDEYGKELKLILDGCIHDLLTQTLPKSAGNAEVRLDNGYSGASSVSLAHVEVQLGQGLEAVSIPSPPPYASASPLSVSTRGTRMTLRPKSCQTSTQEAMFRKESGDSHRASASSTRRPTARARVVKRAKVQVKGHEIRGMTHPPQTQSKVSVTDLDGSAIPTTFKEEMWEEKEIISTPSWSVVPVVKPAGLRQTLAFEAQQHDSTEEDISDEAFFARHQRKLHSIRVEYEDWVSKHKRKRSIVNASEAEMLGIGKNVAKKETNFVTPNLPPEVLFPPVFNYPLHNAGEGWRKPKRYIRLLAPSEASEGLAARNANDRSEAAAKEREEGESDETNEANEEVGLDPVPLGKRRRMPSRTESPKRQTWAGRRQEQRRKQRKTRGGKGRGRGTRSGSPALRENGPNRTQPKPKKNGNLQAHHHVAILKLRYLKLRKQLAELNARKHGACDLSSTGPQSLEAIFDNAGTANHGQLLRLQNPHLSPQSKPNNPSGFFEESTTSDPTAFQPFSTPERHFPQHLEGISHTPHSTSGLLSLLQRPLENWANSQADCVPNGAMSTNFLEVGGVDRLQDGISQAHGAPNNPHIQTFLQHVGHDVFSLAALSQHQHLGHLYSPDLELCASTESLPMVPMAPLVSDCPVFGSVPNMMPQVLNHLQLPISPLSLSLALLSQLNVGQQQHQPK